MKENSAYEESKGQIHIGIADASLARACADYSSGSPPLDRGYVGGNTAGGAGA